MGFYLCENLTYVNECEAQEIICDYSVIISQTTQCSVLDMTRSVTHEETSNAFMKDMDLKSYS
jgi:UDP-N-acetylglucosamine transferase subunit ALG13